ncbi:DUF465 domain-containing protein [Escherichia coli]|nr:DUF465 domain-containing protein [Escherichia coli]
MSKRPFISLMLRHAELERRMREERVRPRPDTAKLGQLKKLKLAVKDRLQRMTAGGVRAVGV